MTEEEWWDHASPGLMLRLKGSAASDRKLWLFTCHCAELVWRSMLQRGDPPHIELAWAGADGLVRQSEVEAAAPAANPDGRQSMRTGLELIEWCAVRAVQAAFLPPTADGLSRTRHSVEALAVQLASDAGQDTARASRTARTALADLLRDIFGNPFRPATFSPEWRTDTVLSLARGMYESRDFSAMPILADALQDAGCDSADALNHCRGPGPHGRGCWVVDLVLGTE